MYPWSNTRLVCWTTDFLFLWVSFMLHILYNPCSVLTGAQIAILEQNTVSGN